MNKLIYRSLYYAHDLLNDLESLLGREGSVCASEVRGRLQSFEACVKELGESVEEWLRRDCNELLRRVDAQLENLQQYSPEYCLSMREREEILNKELPRWRGALKGINAGIRFGFLLTLLEHFRGESERGEINWSHVCEHLWELRGYFKNLEQIYSGCKYVRLT